MIELLIGLSGPVEPPRPSIAVVVVSLDDATQGQIRYGRETVSATGAEYGPIDLAAPPIEDDAFRSCQRYDLARATTCARFYIGHHNAQHARPPVVVVLLSDADADDDRKYGQLEVSCVGVGLAETDRLRQTARLWPDAAGLQSPDDLEADRDALADCIIAAAAESGS